MISYSDHISSSNVAPFFDWSLFRLFHLGKKTPIAHWMILIDVQGVALLGGKSSGKTHVDLLLARCAERKVRLFKKPGAQKKRNGQNLSPRARARHHKVCLRYVYMSLWQLLKSKRWCHLGGVSSLISICFWSFYGYQSKWQMFPRRSRPCPPSYSTVICGEVVSCKPKLHRYPHSYDYKEKLREMPVRWPSA